MSNVSYVYQLRVENEPLPFYVGKGKFRRAWDHERDALSSFAQNLRNFKENKIRKAISQGLSILVEMLCEDLSDEEALEIERTFITLYGRRVDCSGCLVNQTTGGEGLGGYRHTESAKDKVRQSKLGKKAKGNQLLALDRTGRAHTEETKRKISDWSSNKVHSEETKAKIGAKHKGKKIDPAHTAKIKEICSKSFKLMNPEGLLVEGKGIGEISRKYGLNRTCLSLVLNGRQASHKGWTKA